MYLPIKALSINAAYRGRRFKTRDYNEFENELAILLPSSFIVPEGKLKLTMKVGQSASSCDWDNPIKTFQDVLAKKYGFNDKKIFRGDVEKFIVPKGQEFIDWELESYPQENYMRRLA